jgi:hypothetical protein
LPKPENKALKFIRETLSIETYSQLPNRLQTPLYANIKNQPKVDSIQPVLFEPKNLDFATMG